MWIPTPLCFVVQGAPFSLISASFWRDLFGCMWQDRSPLGNCYMNFFLSLQIFTNLRRRCASFSYLA